MRVWSIHPKYLDAKGLVALWREGLLAQSVLLNQTKGYKNHPQLNRFKNTKNPAITMAHYLHHIVDEADKRAYQFNRTKLAQNSQSNPLNPLTVTEGQIKYEFKHLMNKLKIRDVSRYQELKSIQTIEIHPLFIRVDGAIENWEILPS